MTIGNNDEPGVTSNVRSAPSVTASDNSPATPLFVGGANLTNGSAEAEKVYGVSDSAEAQTLFGNDSHLGISVMRALNQGAQPVLAVAPATTTTTQDLSSLGSTSGTLDEPALEDRDTITVTIDGTDKDVSWTLQDPGTLTPDVDEVLINPTNGSFELDSAPSTSGTIEYEALDYSSAFDAIVNYTGDLDVITPLKERTSVVTEALGAVQELAQEKRLAFVNAALPSPIDPQNISISFDTSRLQLFAGVRLNDATSALSSIVGLRSRLGLTTTIINQQVPLPSRPVQGLDATQRANLVDMNVTPLERIGQSVRIADDITTVSDTNTEEQNYRYGFSRMAVDFLMEQVHDMEAPFIGKFNSPGAIGQLEDLLNESARPLDDSNVVYEYGADVTLITPTTARVTFQADVAEPIRFIQNEFVIGQDLSLQNEA
jgi:hypothetical protein